MENLKDAIDFGKEDIPKLFKKMLFPTLVGMMFSAIFSITDGVFVGNGVGSNALAAINFIAPLILLSMGLGLMFGIGASVVASIHLSNGKQKTANINITQAAVISTFILLVISVFSLVFPETLLSIFGCSETLTSLAEKYIYGFAGFMACNSFIIMGGFFIRLSGAPNYAMFCTIIAAVLNILLDYIFIFVLKMGTFGAALATGLGTSVGVVMMICFLANKKNTIHFARVKLSKKSLRLTLRNVSYMCRLGSSSLLGHISIACMVMCGNIVFSQRMGDEGVAAFSVIGYISPLILMLFQAISQSAQPIISYNYGVGEFSRVRKTIILALTVAVIYSIIPGAIMVFFPNEIASLFISETDPVYALAITGIPLHAVSLIPVAINIVVIGYFQSVEQAINANIITLFRGYVFMVGCFVVTPLLWGDTGAWLSTSIAEWLTIIVILIIVLKNRYKRRKIA